MNGIFSKQGGIHFTHFNIKSFLLPKIEELRLIAKSTNSVVISFSERELEESILYLY